MVILIDAYRAFHPAVSQYTLYSAAQGTDSKIDSILGHKKKSSQI
jgi:hypothetical protein